MSKIKETLKIKQIKDSYKTDSKGNVIHLRYVEIRGLDSSFKITFNDDYGDLPSILCSLDENSDLDTEVDVKLEIFLNNRQKKLSDLYNKDGEEE